MTGDESASEAGRRLEEPTCRESKGCRSRGGVKKGLLGRGHKNKKTKRKRSTAHTQMASSHPPGSLSGETAARGA